MTDAAIEQAEPKLLTLDDLLAMGEDARVEIINGRLVPKGGDMAGGGTGGTHHLIGGNIFRILDRDVFAKGIGVVFFDGLTYLMFSPSNSLKDSLVPDVSYIRNENVPAGWNVDKPHPGVPDLAVEVISPGEDAEDIQTKLRTYLDKGTQQVWLVYPRTKELHQYMAGNPETVRIYKGSQTIDAEALFPGIQGLTTDAIFKLPAWAQK